MENEYKVSQGWIEVWRQESNIGGEYMGFEDPFNTRFAATATPELIVHWCSSMRVARVVGIARLTPIHTNFKGSAEFFHRAIFLPDYTQAILWGQGLWTEMLGEFWKGVKNANEQPEDRGATPVSYRAGTT